MTGGNTNHYTTAELIYTRALLLESPRKTRRKTARQMHFLALSLYPTALADKSSRDFSRTDRLVRQILGLLFGDRPSLRTIPHVTFRGPTAPSDKSSGDFSGTDLPFGLFLWDRPVRQVHAEVYGDRPPRPTSPRGSFCDRPPRPTSPRRSFRGSTVPSETKAERQKDRYRHERLHHRSHFGSRYTSG